MFGSHNYFFPVYPHDKNNRVKKILENVEMEQVKCVVVVFDKRDNKCNSEYVEKINHYQSQWYIPHFFCPWTTRKSDDTDKDIGLF